ncbi:U4/U6 small nuclear ribonucleoprotein PRP4-like protein [Rutidosis leptorrhynchoides]|uniref:U4/U6 small nuclear ribonucleoprotein PRP4-like protein n=1 Tax=Rutidosis leptorrhynchoides TaxID=125765 RepID=UPI003A993463
MGQMGMARRKRDASDEDMDVEVNWALENVNTFGLDCSEIGDDRPLLGCSFSCDGKFLATCSRRISVGSAQEGFGSK